MNDSMFLTRRTVLLKCVLFVNTDSAGDSES